MYPVMNQTAVSPAGGPLPPQLPKEKAPLFTIGEPFSVDQFGPASMMHGLAIMNSTNNPYFNDLKNFYDWGMKVPYVTPGNNNLSSIPFSPMWAFPNVLSMMFQGPIMPAAQTVNGVLPLTPGIGNYPISLQTNHHAGGLTSVMSDWIVQDPAGKFWNAYADVGITPMPSHMKGELLMKSGLTPEITNALLKTKLNIQPGEMCPILPAKSSPAIGPAAGAPWNFF